MATYDKLIDLNRLGAYNAKMAESMLEMADATQSEINLSTANQVIVPRNFDETALNHWYRSGPPWATVEVEDGLIKYTQTVFDNNTDCDCTMHIDVNPFECSETNPAVLKIQLESVSGNVPCMGIRTMSYGGGTTDVLPKYSNFTGNFDSTYFLLTPSTQYDKTWSVLISDTRQIDRLIIRFPVMAERSYVRIKSLSLYRNAGQMAEMIGLYD